ncbi:DUF29 domain-containing protein [Azospirillum doebereinerae]|uniref:DUF29 domain-containing protein n=1 Tax=Azospirillum doebereinerae TaxID=92933 RepID=A0A433J847_9PROT|nr:DUF29 domain-containing protein [Azospirillum doebereinerae]RUQ70151.1 DUF29 domain-containing protein [Azospirillum doebereinerae]
MDRASAGYDEDFYAWTQTQAAELRRAGAERTNAPIDWANVAEEIEILGRSQKSEIDSRLSVLLVHLLKWLCCPDLRERCERGWRLTIREQRKKLLRDIKDSPSLRPYVAEVFDDVYEDARLKAAAEADVPNSHIPVEPPFTLDQALDPAYPAALFPPDWRA